MIKNSKNLLKLTTYSMSKKWLRNQKGNLIRRTKSVQSHANAVVEIALKRHLMQLKLNYSNRQAFLQFGAAASPDFCRLLLALTIIMLTWSQQRSINSKIVKFLAKGTWTEEWTFLMRASIMEHTRAERIVAFLSITTEASNLIRKFCKWEAQGLSFKRTKNWSFSASLATKTSSNMSLNTSKN